MKVIFDNQTGTVLARYPSIPNPQFPIDPVAQPGQTLIDLPSDIIGEAVIHVAVTEDASGEPVYSYTLDQGAIDRAWVNVRLERNRRLSECDWICSVTDYTVANKSDWVAYRAALRTVTQQTNPFRLVFPSPPPSSPDVAPAL